MGKILVTGGAGFIGSHTCLHLLGEGYQIIVIDSFVNSSEKSIEIIENLVKSNSNNFQTLNFCAGDIRNKQFVEKIFMESFNSGSPITSVIHFAGLKSVKQSLVQPIEYWDVNVGGTINLINIMNKYNCHTIVFSSSATIYGTSESKNLCENSETNPVNPYGVTKYSVEKLLKDVFNSKPNKWRIINLRYFNPIGAHESGLIGEHPIGIPNNIFPKINKVAIGELDSLSIFGNNWPTPDGTCIRDYIHVMDLADGHIAALNYLNNNKPQITSFNLGTGLGTSVLELIETFERVNKIKINYLFEQRRSGDVARVVADNSLAINKLKWKPKKNLEDMCIDGWKWQKNYPNGFI